MDKDNTSKKSLLETSAVYHTDLPSQFQGMVSIPVKGGKFVFSGLESGAKIKIIIKSTYISPPLVAPA